MSIAVRQTLIDTCLQMNQCGLNQGRAGNAAVRWQSGMLISPTGLAYEALTPADIVFMQLDGSRPAGQRAPSSEWLMHAAILQHRPDVGAVLHAHAPFCTVLACLRRDIPAFHYMVARAGGDSIRCSGYATFGTLELAEQALLALEGRRACLLANHGLLTLGRDLEQALELALEVESLAAQYCRTLSIGQPVLLSAAEMAHVIEKFATYGQQPYASSSDELR